MLFIVNDFNCPSFVQYGQFLTMYWLKIKIINMLSCSVLRACQVVGKRSRHKRSRVKYVTPVFKVISRVFRRYLEVYLQFLKISPNVHQIQARKSPLRNSVRWPTFCVSSSPSSSCSNSDYSTIICLCLGAYSKPFFLVSHFKIKLFPMFSIAIDRISKYRTQARARGRSGEQTLSWTNWLVQ